MSFEGQYYSTDNATIYDRPEQPVPIYIAGAGRPGRQAMPGGSADGFICTSGKTGELYTETLLPNVAAGLAASDAREAAVRPDDRNEGLLRHRPQRALRTPVTGRRWR